MNGTDTTEMDDLHGERNGVQILSVEAGEAAASRELQQPKTKDQLQASRSRQNGDKMDDGPNQARGEVNGERPRPLNVDRQGDLRVVCKEEKEQLFTRIPKCSWKCARVRQQKKFIGLTRVDKVFKVPDWWPAWLASINMMQALTMHDAPDGRYVYEEFPTETNRPQPPPSEEYVVLGLFGGHGNLLEEQVVYIGNSRSKHLYLGTRRLFTVPILRDITSIGLYKCDQEKRVHVRVNLSGEDRDSLNSLFETMRTWSTYHSLRNIAEGLSEDLPLSLRLLYTEGLLSYYLLFRGGVFSGIKRPAVEDERAWCQWLQRNLNGGDLDPAAGQYSIEVVVGWSRRRILKIVVVPFVLFLICTTTFALLWSVKLGAHHGNVSAGFSIASYFAGLAGASVALIGFFGGSMAYK